MTESRQDSRGRRVPRKEPDYVRTVRDDGRKYVDPNEFLKDSRVQEQIRRLSRKARGA
jgi:hypothetical protein